jgi:hypothetical protein
VGGRTKRGRIEVVTVGTNPNRQVVFSSPYGGASDLGLPIGTNQGTTAANQRQLFMLCAKQFNAHERGRLVGIRQLVTIGAPIESLAANAVYPLERPVVTPTWSFVDGNVAWAIRRIPPNAHPQPSSTNQDGLQFGFSLTPALLYQTIVALNPLEVLPPNGGQYPGNVLSPEWGQWWDMRTTDWGRPVPVDIPIEGPCIIAMMASVQQTQISSRTNPPATPVFSTTSGATPEDSFIQTYANAVYQRIAGGLIFEMDDFAPSGMPKTYRDTGWGDRVTRDTTQTGDNTMRQSGAATTDTCSPNDPVGTSTEAGSTQRRGKP